MSTLFLQSLTAFTTTLLAITFLAPLAPKLGLIDEPSKRKLHIGAVPTIGGIAVFSALLLGAAIWGGDTPYSILIRGQNATWIFVACGGVLVVTGILDDLYELGVAIRIFSEIAISLVIVEYLDLRLRYVGDVLNIGHIQLSSGVAYVFTIFAIVGIINAFNMLDGADGLLGSLALSTLVIFHFFTEAQPGLFSVFIGSSIAAFLISNLGVTPLIPKTFLGDAGSRLLGFIVVCFLLGAASEQVGNFKVVKPVTALFLVGLPLFDMVFVIFKRLLSADSPFSADRGHIHHLFQELGFSTKATLPTILMMAVSLNFLGLMLHRSGVQEHYQLSIFICCFILYCTSMSQAWALVKRFKALSYPS